METTRRPYAKPEVAAEPDGPGVEPHVLLVGPYDPAFDEETCLAPPLGVWRIAGVLGAAGGHVRVFDPNCCDEAVGDAFAKILASRTWHLIAFSVTGATLRFDLGLAHLSRRLSGNALIVAGGTEAAFNAEALFRAGPFDLIVLGQGERPLLELVNRLRKGGSTRDVLGTAWIDASGQLHRRSQPARNRQSFRDATFQTPYAQMPFRHYWDKLTHAYKLHDLPVKAERDARLAEVRAIRLDTLDDGSIGTGCACPPPNVLNETHGAAARVTRLEADECVSMVARIASAWPDVRTIVFEDDIFVFTADQRIRPLCEKLLAAKRAGDIPPELQFIGTNRIDAMDQGRLALMQRAGFRILNFHVESFAREMLAELDKAHIWDSITPNLQAALKVGITPFLDLLLTTPRCRMQDVAFNVASTFKWQHGCEASMQPYVIPSAGAAMTRDLTLLPFTVTTEYTIDGTSLVWEQPTKILPVDPLVRGAVLEIEHTFTKCLTTIEAEVAHLPARVRSLLWIACAIPVLMSYGEVVPSPHAAVRAFVGRLPVPPARASKLAAQLTGMIGLEKKGFSGRA
jgi:hypothetical protein